MGLVRAIARPMLAAPFIFCGINQLKNTAQIAPVARPFISKIAEPAGLPNDADLLVKANGAAMVAAGAGLATGILRKPSAAVLAGSLIPTTLAGHAFWEHTDPKEKAEHTTGFVSNLGLLGGLIMTLVDTEGKPGLLYRAKLAREGVGRTADQTWREARHAARAAKREAKIAMLQAKDAVS